REMKAAIETEAKLAAHEAMLGEFSGVFGDRLMEARVELRQETLPGGEVATVVEARVGDLAGIARERAGKWGLTEKDTVRLTKRGEDITMTFERTPAQFETSEMGKKVMGEAVFGSVIGDAKMVLKYTVTVDVASGRSTVTADVRYEGLKGEAKDLAKAAGYEGKTVRVEMKVDENGTVESASLKFDRIEGQHVDGFLKYLEENGKADEAKALSAKLKQMGLEGKIEALENVTIEISRRTASGEAVTGVFGGRVDVVVDAKALRAEVQQGLGSPIALVEGDKVVLTMDVATGAELRTEIRFSESASGVLNRVRNALKNREPKGPELRLLVLLEEIAKNPAFADAKVSLVIDAKTRSASLFVKNVEGRYVNAERLLTKAGADRYAECVDIPKQIEALTEQIKTEGEKAKTADAATAEMIGLENAARQAKVEYLKERFGELLQGRGEPSARQRGLAQAAAKSELATSIKKIEQMRAAEVARGADARKDVLKSFDALLKQAKDMLRDGKMSFERAQEVMRLPLAEQAKKMLDLRDEISMAREQMKEGTPAEREAAEAMDAFIQVLTQEGYADGRARGRRESGALESAERLFDALDRAYGVRGENKKAEVKELLEKLRNAPDEAAAFDILDRLAFAMFGKKAVTELNVVERYALVSHSAFEYQRGNWERGGRAITFESFAAKFREMGVKQMEMVFDGLLGRISALSTGAGKTMTYIMTMGMLNLREGRQGIKAELFTAREGETAQYFRDYTGLARTFGLKLENGGELYRTHDMEGLANAYEGSGGRLVIYDLQARGFVELMAKTESKRLNAALEKVDVRIVDEADVAALSRVAFLLGSGDMVASKGLRAEVARLLGEIEKSGLRAVETEIFEIIETAVAKEKGFDAAELGIYGKEKIELAKKIYEETGGKTYTVRQGGEILVSTKLMEDGKTTYRDQFLADMKGKKFEEGQVANALRAKFVVELKKGEWGVFDKGQMTSIQDGVLQVGTSDTSQTYNVATVLMEIAAYKKAGLSERQIKEQHGLDAEHIKLSQGVGESTLSQIFSRGGGKVLTMGGSATLDVAKQIAESIYGVKAVDIEGSSLKQYFDAQVKKGQMDLRSRNFEAIMEETVKLMLEGEAGISRDRGFLVGAMEGRYLKEALVRTLERMFTAEHGAELGKQIRDAAKKYGNLEAGGMFDAIVRELKLDQYKLKSDVGKQKLGGIEARLSTMSAGDLIKTLSEVFDGAYARDGRSMTEHIGDIARQNEGKSARELYEALTPLLSGEMFRTVTDLVKVIDATLSAGVKEGEDASTYTKLIQGRFIFTNESGLRGMDY
ncbi:MAG TPA: hypothetical protein P5079_10325, partial [Elusimicrobiota bacterium]|nr:hypothetical protein [Elusimicrobiota bacterium]